MDDIEREAIRDEGYDPDDPAVVAALERVRAELAVDELLTALADLRLARLSVVRARDRLTGARCSRAQELCDQLTATVYHCERLCTIVEGDNRADQLTGGQS
jgi:hypothetical protein